MGIKTMNLDYEMFKQLCQENDISYEQLLVEIEERRIIVEPVDDSSNLHLTIINNKEDDGETTNIRIANARFNIKKLVKSLPSIVFDVAGLDANNLSVKYSHGLRLTVTILGLFAIKLVEAEKNVLYSLWHMDDWENDIAWETAYRETNNLLEENGTKAMTEDEFAKALDTLSNYGLIELDQELVSNLNDVSKNKIRLLDHQLYKFEKR